jgi:hypothetical protein
MCKKSRQQTLHATRDELRIAGLFGCLPARTKRESRAYFLSAFSLRWPNPSRARRARGLFLGVGSRDAPALPREIELVPLRQRELTSTLHREQKDHEH